MIAFAVILFPVGLLLFMLLMERVEQPLRAVAVEQDVELARLLPGENDRRTGSQSS
jgi:hypothetical protein